VTIRHEIYPAIDPEPEWRDQTYKEKVVFISGASRGIGQVAAVFYAKAGASVAITGRSQETLNKTKEIILKEVPGAQVLSFAVDVKDSKGVQEAVDATVEQFGRLDVLIANAGAVLPFDTPMVKSKPEDWWYTFEINIFGVYTLVRAAMSHLQKAKGSIIAMSSIGAQLLSPYGSAYNVSKHAVNRLVEFIAQEYPEIRIFSIHPGTVRTQLLEKMGIIEQGTPTPDPPELSVALMIYLTSGKADWLNGRYFDASWDMEETERLWKDTIVEKDLLVNKLAVP